MEPQANHGAMPGEIGYRKISEAPVFHTTDPGVRDTQGTTDILLMQAGRQAGGAKFGAELSLESTTMDGSRIDSTDPVGHKGDRRRRELPHR